MKKISRTQKFHAQGLASLQAWIPVDLKERIERAAREEQREIGVVVTRALLEKFPFSPAALDAAHDNEGTLP